MQELGLSEQEAEADLSHEELAVLDKTGRLQLPREYLDALGVKGRDMLKVELDGKRIVLSHSEEQQAARSSAGLSNENKVSQ